MKPSILARSLALAGLLLTTTALNAQGTAPACPFGFQPGYGRTLGPEQRAAHQATLADYAAELRQKEAQGTLTEPERAWLDRQDRRGGACGVGAGAGCGLGKGPRAGKGPGAGPGNGQGMGQRNRRGQRNGAGGCGNGGGCLNGTTSPNAAAR